MCVDASPSFLSLSLSHTHTHSPLCVWREGCRCRRSPSAPCPNASTSLHTHGAGPVSLSPVCVSLAGGSGGLRVSRGACVAGCASWRPGWAGSCSSCAPCVCWRALSSGPQSGRSKWAGAARMWATWRGRCARGWPGCRPTSARARRCLPRPLSVRSPSRPRAGPRRLYNACTGPRRCPRPHTRRSCRRCRETRTRPLRACGRRRAPWRQRGWSCRSDAQCSARRSLRNRK
jgi:hypothetical protein